MDELERQRKIEAGKSRWAEYKKRNRSKSVTSNTPPNAALSRVHKKNCTVDLGGVSSTSENPLVEKYAVCNLSQADQQTVSENISTAEAVKCRESSSDSVPPVMNSSSQQDSPDSQFSLQVENSAAISESQPTLDSTSSLDSLVFDRIIDESEISSGSDNSTVTGISFDSSKSDDISTENESTVKFLHVPHQIVHQTDNPSHLADQNDNRPDEEKALESTPSEEKEKDVLVEEILISKENIFVNISSVPVENVSLEKMSEIKSFSLVEEEGRHSPALNTAVVDKASYLLEDVNISLSSPDNLTDIEDDQAPYLNADETQLASLIDYYQIKIKKFQEAVQKRDSVISKLSSTLESTMNANQAANSAGNSEVVKLQEEITLLHLKMKETAELFRKQKLKIGNLEFDSCACQTEVIELSMHDTGIQVETSISSLLQSCDLDMTSFFELFAKKISGDSESLDQMVQKLKELLLSHFSHVHIRELVTLLRTGTNIQESDNVPEGTEITSAACYSQYSEKIDSANILKKISSLNMVAKLIESLMSISTGGASDTFSDFSPSKFQSFFLRRLHSMETGDALPDMSENESVVSDINYAEVDSPFNNKPVVESTWSLEKLRRRNVSEDFSLVTDFLQDEMERLCRFLPAPGPHGDGLEFCEKVEGRDSASGEIHLESDHQKILQHRSKLETRLKNLKSLEKDLQDVKPFPHQLSMDSDTMTMSEDNLMMEELPLSCISLLSLTDSEYKGDNITTDSDTNFSRKVSVDMTRSMQERDFCIRCERNVDLLREKYENEIMSLKEQLEHSFQTQKNQLLESISSLESEIGQHKTEKDSLATELNKQIESLSSENIKFRQLFYDYEAESAQLKKVQNELCLEKEMLGNKLKELEEKLTASDNKIRETLHEKTEIEIALRNQIADLIQEHEQDMEALRLDSEAKSNLEKKHLENNYRSSFEVLKKIHEEEINNLKCQIKKEFEEREQNLLNEHSKTINMIEAAHCDESAGYQKRIEQLLEEKCELLNKTTQEYEKILKKNHRVLVILCKQLLAKVNTEKQRIANESLRLGGDLDLSFSALEELNNSLENGLVKFLNQNYFMNSNNEEFYPDDTEYLPIEISFPICEDDLPIKIETKKNSKKDFETKVTGSSHEPSPSLCIATSESSLDSDDLYLFHAEINKIKEEYQNDIAFYKNVNDQLHSEIKSLRTQLQEIENQKQNLEVQLQEKERELTAKESLLSATDATAVKGGSQLSATDISSWQVQAAQTNSRLLHVLSDLVKTFLDIEHDINTHLRDYGLIASRSGNLGQNDDDTGQSIGSREDFTSLSLGDCPNLEMTEDGPDLTPRAWDVFVTAGNYEADLEGEDVVLGASRRLRLAVDHVLNLLSRALENQQSQDLKLLLKRNEELSQDLQEESQGRDAVHMELVTAESTVRKLESEKQRLEDLSKDLKNDYEILKRELIKERSSTSLLKEEKESALDEIHTLKEQCELLASRLGDPEKTENDKILNTTATGLHENSELLQENSRLSSEKQTVQKNLCKERQSFLDRLHQMEIDLEELNAEKDDLVDKKCKEIRDLKAEMEAMEKQLQSNRKFIEQQAVERELERDEFLNKINKMEEFIKEKERIQSNETQLTKEIEQLEEILRARIEDHQKAMSKKDEVERELRQAIDKIKDLKEIIEELEKQLDAKSKIEVELRKKLANVCESIPNQDKNCSLSDSGDSLKNVSQLGESMEHLHNLKEQLASRSQEIETMSQSHTLLQELRGQLHFLEAKVEQRARLLESSLLSAASSPIQSGATSPSSSQDSESLQIPCEDGWAMSPRSIHWLEVRRLEEKIGRLAHIDEELLRKIKELEQQLKKIKSSFSESQHENTALQEKVSEQLVEISALKSHIEEQKHRSSTPQKSHSLTDKIENLQEQLEKQCENNKRLVSDFQEAQSSVIALQEEIQRKEEIIAALQECAETKSKSISLESDKESDHSIIEDLRNELYENNKALIATETENAELRSDIERLKTENRSLECLLQKAEKEVKTERAQVEALYEEIANLAENSKEGALSLNKSNCNDTKASSLNEEDHASKVVTWENCLKEKNLEILMLKAAVTKLESSLRTAEQQLEFEKVLVETLQQELGSLTTYQKRLEQDFNTVQDMMQQKERELATLHEETDAQMKLEDEMESLEKKLSDQKNVESELRENIEELENQLHCLKKQIAVLKKFSTVTKSDTDIEELANKIMEVVETFKPNGTNDTFQEVLVSLLKNSVDIIVKNLRQNHEEHISSLNKSWQEKINEEITCQQNIYKRENDNLIKTFLSEKEILAAEKDAFWLEKIKEMEVKLKKEQVKRKKTSDSAKAGKNQLQTMLTDEINSLKENLETAVKERVSLESIVKDLKIEISKLKLSEEEQRSIISREYENKLSGISKTIEESFKSEKQKLMSACDHLQKELNAKLEEEKKNEHKHKEELASIHRFFETRWANEMKKLKDFQSEDLKNNQKTLEDKVHKLQEKFDNEKKLLLDMKEKAVKEACDLLEKKFNQNLVEIQKKVDLSSHAKLSDEQRQRKWEEEKLQLISSHRKELHALKQELKSKYEKQLQAQSAAHSAEIKQLDETYNKQVEEVNDLIKEAQRAASKSGYTDVGSNRTTTPSSDMTSSDEACSSCKEDMLSANKHLLVDKIHQDGKRVLSLIESSAQPLSSVKDAHLWLEERKWIVNKLKVIAPVTSNANLKIIVSNIVDEIQKFRRNFETALEENSELKQRTEDLEQQLSIKDSKLSHVNMQLKKEKSSSAELESLLSLKASELFELKKKLAEISSFVQNSAERELAAASNGNTRSSYEIEYARSADDPKSAEKFSMFLPEIDHTHSSEFKTPSHKESSTQEMTIPKFELPKFDMSPMISTQNSSPLGVADTARNEMSQVKEKLMAVLNKGIDVTDAKLHGLYWVFRRSQSYNKALIYQKKYLLMLLRSFQVTEKVTLAWLKHMEADKPSSYTSDTTIADSPLHARSRFRAAAFAIVALQRMKSYVRRWRLLARIPPSQLINVEIQSVFQNYSFLSPASSPGYHLSSNSLASVPLSLAGRECRSSQMSTSSRADNKSRNSTNPDKSQLIEYVHRLEVLQKQLGLDSLR